MNNQMFNNGITGQQSQLPNNNFQNINGQMNNPMNGNCDCCPVIPLLNI